MPRSKQKKPQKKDGQHRAETKEERRARLAAEAEAKEQCLKLLPYVGGVVVFLLIVFALYVRSVPPKTPKPKQTIPIEDLMGETRVMTEGIDVLKESPNEDSDNEMDQEPSSETIEL